MEIYIKGPIWVLEERNQKNLYQEARKGSVKDVVGVDLELQFPKNPDILIINDGVKTPEEMCSILIEKLSSR